MAVGQLRSPRKGPRGRSLTVSIQSSIKHTPHGMTDAAKEWEKFLNGMRANWWRKNLDLIERTGRGLLFNKT